MLTEMTGMIAPMEVMGYRLPESMLPDISGGRLFCRWLRDTYGIDTDALPTYLHVFEDGAAYRQRPTRKACWRFSPAFSRGLAPQPCARLFSASCSEASQFLPKLIANNKPKKLN